MHMNSRLRSCKNEKRQLSIFFFIVWGVVICNGMGILRGPTRQLMFSRRAAYGWSMLLTCACADLRGKHRQPTRTYAPILHRLAYADPTQSYALQAKSYAADFQ